MNNLKKLFFSVTIAVLTCIISPLSAARSATEIRQKINKLEAIKAQLEAVNLSPILTSGANPSDTIQLRSMVIEDIKNIKDDLKRIQNGIKELITNDLDTLRTKSK